MSQKRKKYSKQFKLDALQIYEKGEKWEEHGLIFLNIFGRPISCENLYAQFKQFLKRNGLRGINFQDLRHTSISLLLEVGIPVNTV